MKRSESIDHIAVALSVAQSTMRGALKEHTNPAFRSRYADLAAYIDASREALAANGLALSQGCEADGPKVTITSLLMHKSGQWLESALTLTATKLDPQGIGSAISYGRRYAIAALLNMAATDDDGNAASELKDPVAAQETPRPKPQAAAHAPAAPASATTSAPSPTSVSTTADVSEDALTDVYKEVAEMTGHLPFVKFLWSDIKDRNDRYRLYEELAKILDEIDRRMGTALASKLIATVFNSNGWDDQKPTEVAARKVITALRATVSTGEVPLTMKAATVPADPYDSNEPPF